MATTVSPEFMAETYSVPTVIANRFIVSVTDGGVRLVYGEAPPGQEGIYFRGAVQMTAFEALELAKLLTTYGSLSSSVGSKALGGLFGLGAGDAKPEQK